MSWLDYVAVVGCLVVMALSVGNYLGADTLEKKFLYAWGFIVWTLLLVNVVWTDSIPKPVWFVLGGLFFGYWIGREIMAASFLKELDDLKERYEASMAMNNLAVARWDLIQAMKKQGLLDDDKVDN